MKSKKLILLLSLLLVAQFANAQESIVDSLLQKYMGEIRYKNVISDEILEVDGEKFRSVLVEAGGYYSGVSKGNGPCGSAEITKLYQFSIFSDSDKRENVNDIVLSDDCNGGPRLTIKQRNGEILIGEEKFIPTYIYHKDKLNGHFTDVDLFQ